MPCDMVNRYTPKTPHFVMKNKLALVLLVLFVGSCASTPNVDSLYDQDADFSLFKTYSFAPTRSENTSNYASLSDKFIKVAVGQELSARGYTQSDNPDLLVYFRINTSEKTDIYSMQRPVPLYRNYRFGYVPWPDYTSEVRTHRHTESTLNIDLVDTKRKQMVWEGVAVGRFRNCSLENLDQEVLYFVKLIFEKYPFRAGKS